MNLANKGKIPFQMDISPIDHLIFVFNADHGIMSLLFDGLHKILSPSTYQCELCALTYGNFGKKKAFKRFIKLFPYPIEFLHRDEFLHQYPDTQESFPFVALLGGKGLSILISKEEMKGLSSVDEVIEELNKKLSPHLNKEKQF